MSAVSPTATVLSSTRGLRLPGFWQLSLSLIGLLVALPIVTIIFLSLFPEDNIWSHLSATVLPRYVRNTILLLIGVGAGVSSMGLTTAWLVTAFDFPGRKILEWMLLLPLAVPAYVIAYIYTDLLDFAGPIQTIIRDTFGFTSRADYWFPGIRTLGGAIGMMSLVLFPYVYMLCRAAFLEISPNMLDAARNLGLSPLRVFFSIVIPVIRPALTLGVALALMEALNDFGTVDFFAVQTLTTGLYDTWLNMNNLGGAAQIALVMLIFVAVLLATERLSRRRQRFYQSDGRLKKLQRTKLKGAKGWFASIACALPLIFGFIVPALVLLQLAIINFDQSWTPEFREQTINSLTLSTIAALIVTSFALVVTYAHRIHKGLWTRTMHLTSMLGYAMPGVVLALGLMVAYSSFDNSVDSLSRRYFDHSTGLLLSGSIFAVVCAYVIRFLAIGVASVESSMSRITPSMELAARSMGFGTLRTLLTVHIPLLRTGLIAAALVVFVDCMKELPATLILRPFNFETLAVAVYHQAGDEMIERASLGALVIVAAGILPVIVLSSAMRRTDRHKKR